MRRALVLLALVSGCASAPDAPAGNHPLGWMSGCWENAAGTYREVWSAPDHGYLFGHALSLMAGEVTFFEQTRIDPGKVYVYNAYPGGDGPSPFPEVERDETSVTFANPDHDYPQSIRYVRDGDRMVATISLMDGSDGQGFSFRPCKG